MPKVRQLHDLQELSLSEFCERVGWRTTATRSGGRRRDIVDVLATVAWFRFLQSKWPDSSPYALGQRVEPEGYTTNESGERSHRNKWAKFARGLHVPNKTLVNKAERLVPGSRRILNNALWEVLRRLPCSAHAVTLPEAMLGHEAQRVVARWKAHSNVTLGCASGGFGRNLEDLASLDALAVMVVWCQAAQLLGESEPASDWVYRIYRMLMLMGGDLYMLGIARPLFELLQARVLCEVSHAGWRYHFPAERYTQALERFESVACWLQDFPCPLLFEKRQIRRVKEILDGRYGHDLRCALKPLRQPVGSTEALTESDLRCCQLDRRTFDWAWTLLDAFQRHLAHPPDHVLLGRDPPAG